MSFSTISSEYTVKVRKVYYLLLPQVMHRALLCYSVFSFHWQSYDRYTSFKNCEVLTITFATETDRSLLSGCVLVLLVSHVEASLAEPAFFFLLLLSAFLVSLVPQG
eukprot:TRINITY_DN622_c0_g1_i6.p1 TRINITY_DN622_c0_g1~~TRINITY_DN622_c0_g1_i6.p1  ORF type:complete len:107 (+),score=5.28 TRINITY_DN622_c0_g1_i6:329-649(+)